MFGARIITFFTAALAGSTIVSAMAAGPVEARAPGSGAVEAIAIKRQESTETQVTDIISNLRTTIAPTLTSFKTLIAAGDFSEDDVTPLFSDLTGAIDAATSSLSSITPAARLRARQDTSGVATAVAGLLEDITGALDGIIGSLATIPALGGLLGGLDTALNQLLHGLEGLLAGLLNLVAQLLVNVAALLRQLALGLTLASLGL